MGILRHFEFVPIIKATIVLYIRINYRAIMVFATLNIYHSNHINSDIFEHVKYSFECDAAIMNDNSDKCIILLLIIIIHLCVFTGFYPRVYFKCEWCIGEVTLLSDGGFWGRGRVGTIGNPHCCRWKQENFHHTGNNGNRLIPWWKQENIHCTDNNCSHLIPWWKQENIHRTDNNCSHLIAWQS